MILSSELGLRLSDVCNLEWASFDFKHGRVTLWMEKTNERLSLRMTPKVKKLAVSLKQTDKRWVFPEQRETWQRAQSTLSHQFKRACEALNLPGRSFHGLRASYANHEYARQANAPVNATAMDKVAANLGHRSTKTTVAHYVRIWPR